MLVERMKKVNLNNNILVIIYYCFELDDIK